MARTITDRSANWSATGQWSWFGRAACSWGPGPWGQSAEGRSGWGFPVLPGARGLSESENDPLHSPKGRLGVRQWPGCAWGGSRRKMAESWRELPPKQTEADRQAKHGQLGSGSWLTACESELLSKEQAGSEAIPQLPNCVMVYHFG